MTFDPYETTDPTRAKNLADVLAWLTTTEDLEDYARQEYRLAVEWAARHIRKPPSDILADRDAVLSNFSNQAYTTDLAKTFEAFKRRRRNLSCAIRGATGAIAARRERRKRSDGWNVLIQRVKLLTDEGRGLPGLHVKALIALDVLADLARMFKFDTRDVCAQTIRQLEHEAPDLSESLQKACDILDRLPSLNDATLNPLLPAEPIKFHPRPKRETFLLPKPLEDELAVWVGLAAKGDWIETDEESDPNVDSKPYRTAARKIISTALEIGCVKLNQLATIAPCFDKGVLVEVVKALRRWYVEGHPKAIKPKTAREYLEKLKKVLEVNGECSKHVRKILRKSKWLKSAKLREGRMPQRTRSFCRNVVRDLNARIRFLSLHIYFRKKAIFHLKAVATEPARAAHHRKRARSFGTMAAFAALMTDAVPARIGSILPVTYRCKAPWLELGRKRVVNGHLCIPAGNVKNGVGISAQISAHSQFRGLETLRWYEAVIRPLFPYHDRNDFFFPAVKKADAPLGYHTFLSWWSAEIAEAGFPGMTPHMFRHGQVSILISNNPGDWATVAARIGDRETTVREYYAWIDEERLILKGQQRLAEAFYHAA